MLMNLQNSEGCACLSPRLHLPADWCKQAAAASGTGKEQGEPMEGEKRGLPAVEMKKGAASVPSSLVTVWQILGCLWVPDCQRAGGIGSRQAVGIAS